MDSTTKALRPQRSKQPPGEHSNAPVANMVEDLRLALKRASIGFRPADGEPFRFPIFPTLVWPLPTRAAGRRFDFRGDPDKSGTMKDKNLVHRSFSRGFVGVPPSVLKRAQVTVQHLESLDLAPSDLNRMVRLVQRAMPSYTLGGAAALVFAPTQNSNWNAGNSHRFMTWALGQGATLPLEALAQGWRDGDLARTQPTILISTNTAKYLIWDKGHTPKGGYQAQRKRVLDEITWMPGIHLLGRDWSPMKDGCDFELPVNLFSLERATNLTMEHLEAFPAHRPSREAIRVRLSATGCVFAFTLGRRICDLAGCRSYYDPNIIRKVLDWWFRLPETEGRLAMHLLCSPGTSDQPGGARTHSYLAKDFEDDHASGMEYLAMALGRALPAMAPESTTEASLPPIERRVVAQERRDTYVRAWRNLRHRFPHQAGAVILGLQQNLSSVPHGRIAQYLFEALETFSASYGQVNHPEYLPVLAAEGETVAPLRGGLQQSMRRFKAEDETTYSRALDGPQQSRRRQCGLSSYISVEGRVYSRYQSVISHIANPSVRPDEAKGSNLEDLKIKPTVGKQTDGRVRGVASAISEFQMGGASFTFSAGTSLSEPQREWAGGKRAEQGVPFTSESLKGRADGASALLEDHRKKIKEVEGVGTEGATPLSKALPEEETPAQDLEAEATPAKSLLWERIRREIEAWIGDEGATYQAHRIQETCAMTPEVAWITFEAIRAGTSGWSKRGAAIGALMRIMGTKGEGAKEESTKSWGPAILKVGQALQEAGWMEEPTDGTPFASTERQKATLNGYKRLPLGPEGLEARKDLLKARRTNKAEPASPSAELSTVDAEAVRLWQQFLDAAHECFFEESYKEWIEPCRPKLFSIEDQTLWVVAASEFARTWILTALANEVTAAREASGLAEVRLEFDLDPEWNGRPPQPLYLVEERVEPYRRAAQALGDSGGSYTRRDI